MRAFSRITFLFVAVVLVSVNGLMAQRIIKGTVYKDGEPAAGITVEANRGSSMMTSFDGKYEVEADPKTKWLSFTYIDETKKLNIDENSGDNIDFPFTGELPSGDGDGGSNVIVKSHDQLVQDGNKDYMNESSLYYEDYQNRNMKTAYPHWRKVYSKYPAATRNIYIHGENIFEDLIEKAPNDGERDKFLDEMMKMYDKRIKYFEENGSVLARKATALLEYKIASRSNPVEDRERNEVMKKAYDWINTSISELGNKSAVSTVTLFMNTTVSLFRLGELPKETVLKNYDICNTILDAIIKANEDQSEVRNAKDIAIPYVEKQLEESGAADCESLINIYTPQFEENNDDAEFIKTMLSKLRKAKCENIELIDRATIRLYNLEPSAEAAFNMAHSYLLKEDIENAKKYYLQAIEQEKDKSLLANYYYEYGFVLYSKENKYAEARDNVKKAIAADPSFCKAYMLVGDIYVAASSSFSSVNFEKSAVFWVAVDYYNKAKSYQDCATDATQKISDYKKYYPSQEDGFMLQVPVNDGDDYKVGGWINETTKARYN